MEISRVASQRSAPARKPNKARAFRRGGAVCKRGFAPHGNNTGEASYTCVIFHRLEFVAEMNTKAGKQSLRDTLRTDFRTMDLKEGMQRDYREMMALFLTDEQKTRLHKMGMFRKIFYVPIWIFRAMLLLLTPARRFVLLIGVLLVMFTQDSEAPGMSGGQFLGALMFVFILVLELKDKILARDELEAGRAVQIALMPDERPKFKGWDIYLFTRPANDVGGDLVDFIYVDEDRLGLSLGDVAGKGLGAALFMAKLQATIRALAPGRASISDLGTQLSEIFDRDGIPSRFASLVYLEISRGAGEVRVLNAGHMPPMVFRRGVMETMPRGGPALGLLCHRDYAELPLTLNTDDLLVVYSDGVTEARNPAGDFFSDERLQQLLLRYHELPVHELGKLLVDRVDHFCAEAPRHDDLSLLLLRKTDDF